MKRLLKWIALFVVAVVVCIWRLPASLVALTLPPGSARVMQLHRADGTLWNGSAQMNVTGIPSTLSVGWICRPTLLPFGAQCTLSDAISGSLNVVATSGMIVGEQLTMSVPLEIAPAAGVAASAARVAATINRVELSATSLALRASLRADDARYRVGQTDVTLGEVTADCTPNADNVSSSCSIANRGGNARLDGKISLTGSKASGTLELTPGNGPPQRVSF